jgi:predicted metal-binding protein
LASSGRVTWYTVELTSVAKHFNLFQNHSLSWAKLQNVTELQCADCSGQIVDMNAMQQLKASEEGCPSPVLLCNWLLYFQAKVKFQKKWNTDIKITSQLKIATSTGNGV